METMKVDGCKSSDLSALILMLSEYLDLKPVAIHLTPLYPINIRLIVSSLVIRSG